MKIHLFVGAFVFLYCQVTCTNISPLQEFGNERHPRVPVPANLDKTLSHRVYSWETTHKPPRTKKKLKHKLRSNINVTEIIGYLNSNSSKHVKIVNPELEGYLNSLGNFSLKNNTNDVVSNLNSLINIVKNFNCDINNGGCSQFCKDVNGTKCTCLGGFNLDEDGKNCLDVNECLLENGGCSHMCVNTHGSYYCVCPKGLRLGDDFKMCKDINECVLRNGHGPCQDVCTNTFGSYICSCGIKGSRLSPNRHSCEDVDECLDKTSGCSHGCINIIGGAVCTCFNGMALQDDLKTCYDPEEQSDDARTCLFMDPPPHGYFQCLRKKPLEYFDVRKNDLMVSRSGVTCRLVCLKGYKTIGDYRVTCREDGIWTGNKTGRCLPISVTKYNPRKNFIKVFWAYSKPKITCSPPMLMYVRKEQKLARVRLKPPKTNVSWKNVKSFPPQIKQTMEVYLPIGYHSVVFEATDFVTKLSSKCVISIIIRKEN